MLATNQEGLGERNQLLASCLLAPSHPHTCTGRHRHTNTNKYIYKVKKKTEGREMHNLFLTRLMLVPCLAQSLGSTRWAHREHWLETQAAARTSGI